MTKITQSFIFAAGRGERMRPLTDAIPKPLVEVKNKPIIDYIIEKIDKIADFQKIIINGFYLADKIEDHIKNLSNKKIIFSRESSKIETGGGLLFAANNKIFDRNQPILLINGDILWQESNNFSDIKYLCESYRKQDCDILLGLKKSDEVLGYDGDGDFNLSENGALFKGEKKPLSHVFVGLQIINPKILQNIKEECFSMSYFYKKFNAKEDGAPMIKGLELKSRYFHIGDIAAISAVERVL